MRTLIGTLVLASGSALAVVPAAHALVPAALALVPAALALVPAALAAPQDFDGATLQRVGFGGGGHRHEKTADSTPKKPEKPQPKPPPETTEQHKAYLNRYGFGQ